MKRSPNGINKSHSNSGDADRSDWIGRTLPNGLRILEEITSSRDGMLFRAEHATGHAVALLIPGEATAGQDLATSPNAPLHQRSLFLQATRIRHLNVAAVHEIGQLPGGPGYVVLELLTGEPLSDLLAKQDALPAREAVELFIQAAAGVEAAHAVGLVHANLSPENFLVTETAGGPLVKLIGFAPLAWSSPAVGARRHTGGDPYSSPERLAGHPADARSDVYSLGAILYHMLVGLPPGSGLDIPGSDAVRDTVARAIHPIPERRFQTVSELTRSVKRAMGLGADPWRTRSRRRVALTVVGVVAILAVGIWQSASTSRRAPGSGSAQDAGVVEDQVSSVSTAGGDMVSTTPPVVPDSTDAMPAQETVPAPAPVAAPAVGSAKETVVRSNGSSESLVQAYQPMESSASGPAAEVDSGGIAEATDTGAISLPPPPAAFLTIEERAQVDHRIGLDEARQVLGGPAHAIEGMSLVFVGIARGRFPEGADTTRALVRAVYLDPNGALILLDQQRVGTEPPAADLPGIRFAIGKVMLYLQGENGTATLANLVKRVR